MSTPPSNVRSYIIRSLVDYFRSTMSTELEWAAAGRIGLPAPDDYEAVMRYDGTTEDAVAASVASASAAVLLIGISETRPAPGDPRVLDGSSLNRILTVHFTLVMPFSEARVDRGADEEVFDYLTELVSAHVEALEARPALAALSPVTRIRWRSEMPIIPDAAYFASTSIVDVYIPRCAYNPTTNAVRLPARPAL